MDFSNKKILITGGAGYIGSHVCLELKTTNAAVAILDNLSTGFKENIQYGTLTTLDLSNHLEVNQFIATFKPNAIIHFAGSIVVPDSVSNPTKYYSNNTINSLNLIKSAIEHGVESFLFSSTAAVYGTPESGICKESSPTHPINPYGRSKLMTEWMLDDICKTTTMQYVALRYFNVAGAHPSGTCGQRMSDATHLIKIIAQVLTNKRESLSIFGTDYPTDDGTCIRDYIHVCDLANAHKLALNYLFEGGQSTIFNCGYSSGYSVQQVVDASTTLFGKFTVNNAPRRDGDPPILIADSSKLIKALNWAPQYNNLQTIIQSAIEFEQKI